MKELNLSGTGRYLLLTGGFCSPDGGCPEWGTNDARDIRFIGDRVGTLHVRTVHGELAVPLVIGYTAWLHFQPEDRYDRVYDGENGEIRRRLSEALYLKDALANGPAATLCVDAGETPEAVWVEDSPEKNTTVVFTEATLTNEPEPFFRDKTVTAADVFPENVREHLRALQRLLHTFDDDFARPLVEAPDVSLPFTVKFSGPTEAKIAENCVKVNVRNLFDRTDEDGFIHTSYKNAPSWWYGGFGTYNLNQGTYYGSFYSRDGGRAILTLNAFGTVEKALAGCAFGYRCLNYWRENGLTLGGKPIPGHFTVIPNMPLIYSTFLAKMAKPALSDDPDATGVWPTKYKESVFGKECDNLGNQETDGHGLMMMGLYLSWKNAGRKAAFVQEHLQEIREAAAWLFWCFAYPELSFVKDGLLYGETEAAMNDYTLYTNVPCCLGLFGFAEMFAAAELPEEAAQCKNLAENLKNAITRGFSRNGVWIKEKHGFFHDPVLTMMADVFGYDLADMFPEWTALSRASYPADLQATVTHGWYGASGIGYNHSMITQNALLTDSMADAAKLITSLARLSYAPRLPDPYMVPEGLAVDAENGVFRRQGDLGNLVQLCEAMKCYLLVLGISPMNGDTLKIMPRLPEGWAASVKDFPVQNGGFTVDVTVSAPENNEQSITVSPTGRRVLVRFGPFPKEAKEAKATLNGVQKTVKTFASGDSSWAWVTAEENENR